MAHRIALAALLVVVFAAAARAVVPGDGVVVEFKDGSSMTGVLVKQGRKKIHLDFGGAQMSFGLDTVKSVKPSENKVKKFNDMVKAAGDDFDKLLQAAAYARANGLDTCYDRLVDRLGVANERDLDDAANNEMMAEQAQDYAAARAAWEAKLEEERRVRREAWEKAHPKDARDARGRDHEHEREHEGDGDGDGRR